MSRETGGLRRSGSNEVEIVEFVLGKQSFGINVSKVREFVPFDDGAVTALPRQPASMLGMFVLRGKTIPLTDLNAFLGRAEDEEYTGQKVVIVTEFNQRNDGFVVDRINKIHRLSWDKFEPMHSFLGTYDSHMIGTVSVEGREILVLDLEHIIGDVSPDTLITYEKKEGEGSEELKTRRAQVKLVLAEDSGVIRKKLVQNLADAGYGQVSAYSNGKEAYEQLIALAEKAASGQPLGALVNGLVTDIEMPAMDGLTLCKKITDDPRFEGMPVLMFSSLINKNTAEKCYKAGAKACTTKPDMGDLIDLIDQHILSLV